MTATSPAASDMTVWATPLKGIDTPFKWALMVREPLQQWTRERVTLLGDACHPTLPFLAQGAAMAIEDGAMLARCLRETAGPQHALRRYQEARVERTTRIVRGSAANTKRFHNPALASAEGALQYVDREWNEAQVRERYHWLFDYRVDQVALPA